jgi:hypothetical protein
MKRILSVLTGLALLSQANHAVAQAEAAKSKGLQELFSSLTRFSIIDDGRSAPTEKVGEERTVLFRASCEKIMKEGLRVTWLNSRNGKMKLQLRGIYTQGSALYFQIRLLNRSPLDYDVAGIRFLIAEPANRKHPMVIVSELQPVYIFDSSTLVRGYGRITNVLVLPRFTLPRGKRLLVEVLEKNGGRHLQVAAGNFILEKARII